MNKLFILGAFATVGLASCKKDYTCTCTSNGVSQSETISDTKANARPQCDEGDSREGIYEINSRECELN